MGTRLRTMGSGLHLLSYLLLLFNISADSSFLLSSKSSPFLSTLHIPPGLDRQAGVQLLLGVQDEDNHQEACNPDTCCGARAGPLPFWWWTTVGCAGRRRREPVQPGAL